MGIMLILTLTISAFKTQEDLSGQILLAGDYSAVFPLLVISVFISAIASRDVVFYAAQSSRGDIIAVPEVLCRPGLSGAPVVLRYDSSDNDSTDSACSDTEEHAFDEKISLLKSESLPRIVRSNTVTSETSHRRKNSTCNSTSSHDRLVRHETFGDLEGHQQPSLLDQARLRSSSSLVGASTSSHG